MKVLEAGRIVADGVAQAPELIRYAASRADTAIIGCWAVEEVRQPRDRAEVHPDDAAGIDRS